MKIKNKGIVLTIMVMAVFVASGCYKVATVTIDNTPVIKTSVSFSKDIIPILGKSCAVSGCHNSGGHAPDLSEANAYSALSATYISKSDTANSIVYLWLTGKESTPMPMGASNNPSNINALMLAWIKQGAKNN